MGRNALVVGAGVGGLCTAIGLRRAGWSVTVLERWPTVVGIGAGLGVWPDAQRALAGVGLEEEFRAAAVDSGAANLWRHDGRRLAPVPTARVDRRAGMPVRIIARSALMDLLVAAAGDTEIRTGTDVRDVPGLVSTADVVVGADGLRSAVRDLQFGPVAVRYLGCVAWRAQIDGEPAAYGETAYGETWGPGALVGTTPVSPGRTNVYVAVRTPLGQVEQWTDVRDRLASWHPVVADALSRVDGAGVLRHELADLPTLPSLVQGKTALLGDAAHAMAPSLGRGASEAILDAAALVSALTHERDVPAALRTYDTVRRRPGQRTAARSRTLLRVATAERWTRPRDLAVRIAGVALR